MAGSPRTRIGRSTPRRSQAWTGIFGSSRSLPKGRRSRSASSSSARSTTRWGWKRPIPICLRRAKASGWSPPPGWSSMARWTSSIHRRSRARAKTATTTGWSTRSIRRSSTTWSSTSSTTSGPAATSLIRQRRDRGRHFSRRSAALRATGRTSRSSGIAASPTSRPHTTGAERLQRPVRYGAKRGQGAKDHPVLPPQSGRPIGVFASQGIFTDFKRHDLGPNFWERNFDGSLRREFMTEPLWGVATTAPYGHDGRSVNLREVILRHGGEAQEARDAFAALSNERQRQLLEFLGVARAVPAIGYRVQPGSGDPGTRTFRSSATAASRSAAVQRSHRRGMRQPRRGRAGAAPGLGAAPERRRARLSIAS